MNKVFLIGRLVAKPLLQSTGAVNFTRFCIAITRKYTNSEGFKETDFINVLVWNKQAENICNYLDKGNQIAIEGRIQTNKYQDKDGQVKHVYQTSWGVSTRLIGAIIMVHGDDNGLVLPPHVAPTQVVIIPIQQAKPGIVAKCQEIKHHLEEQGVRVKFDDSDRTPGWKFSEYEMKGVPLRIELGPRDLEKNQVVLCKRNDGAKEICSIDDIEKEVKNKLEQIHNEMYQKALDQLLHSITEVHTYDELKEVVNVKGGYAKMMWCGDEACENKIKEDTNATSRCMPFDQRPFGDTCPICGKKATKVVLFAKAY